MKAMIFSETIAACDLKVGRRVYEGMGVFKVKVIS